MNFFDRKTYTTLLTDDNLRSLPLDKEPFHTNYTPSNKTSKSRENVRNAINLRQAKQKNSDFCLKLQELKERIDVYH